MYCLYTASSLRNQTRSCLNSCMFNDRAYDVLLYALLFQPIVIVLRLTARDFAKRCLAKSRVRGAGAYGEGRARPLSEDNRSSLYADNTLNKPTASEALSQKWGSSLDSNYSVCLFSATNKITAGNRQMR